jgi:hypothetical protein
MLVVVCASAVAEIVFTVAVVYKRANQRGTLVCIVAVNVAAVTFKL